MQPFAISFLSYHRSYKVYKLEFKILTNIKNMKKLLLILSIASLGLLNACTEKLEPATQPSTSSVDAATSARISSSIKTEFPSASNIVISSFDDKKTYGVDFEDKGISHECCCSSSGQILSIYKSSDNVTLPDAIKTYLETTYKGYKLEKVAVGKDANGKASTKVMIEYNDQKITIVFDDKNIAVATFSEPKNNVGGDKNKVFVTKLADLPANIQSQLTGYEFIGAVVKVNSDNSKKTYFVTAKKDGIFYEFTYDNDGKLVKTESIDPSKKPENKEVKESDLPKVIQDYIKLNYKDWKFEQAAILKKNDAIDSYSVILSKDKTKLTLLTFDKDGKFVSAKEVPVIQLPKIEIKDLTANDLPQVIKDYMNKTYAGWTFTKGTVVLKDGVAEGYNINFSVGSDKYLILFDKDGKFLLAKRG
jgi:Putative beta-lactamase-inhibitor-like, PepSY-like